MPRGSSLFIIDGMFQAMRSPYVPTLRLATVDSQCTEFRYSPDWDPSGTLMTKVTAFYRRHLVQMTAFMHSGASASVRDFARAFDLKKRRRVCNSW